MAKNGIPSEERFREGRFKEAGLKETRLKEAPLTGMEPLLATAPGRPQGGWVVPVAALTAALSGLFLFGRRWRAARFLGGLTLALLEKRREIGMARKIRSVLTRADAGRAAGDDAPGTSGVRQ